MPQTALKEIKSDIRDTIQKQIEAREKFGQKQICHKDITTFDGVFSTFSFDDKAKPSPVAENIGAFCSVKMAGSRFSMWVRPSDFIASFIIESMLMITGDNIWFEIIGYEDGTALVVANYNVILGSRWLAVIDAATIPQPVSEDRPPLHLVEKKGHPVHKVEQDVLIILSKMVVEGQVAKLSCGQLAPTTYARVNKVLELLGGKWSRKFGGHIFQQDPTELLESVLVTGTVAKPEKFGFFPTQPELAGVVVDLAWLEEGMKVLEPSAGDGGLADSIAAIVGAENLDCIEIQNKNVQVLRKKGYQVTEADFMSVPAPALPYHSRVIMNPPFERQQDIDHVLHAWNFLKPGGRLIAIMASSVKFRENKKTIEFREFVERNRGKIIDNPEGSFKASGTGVSTITVCIDKETV